MRSKRIVKCSLVLLSAVVLCAAGSAGPGTPVETAKAYFKHIEKGTPHAAIGELFDSGDFIRRALGAEFDRLNPSERVYVTELVQVGFKAAVGMTAGMGDVLKSATVSEPKARMISETEAVVAMSITYPNGQKHTTEFRMVRKPSGSVGGAGGVGGVRGWIIVDLMPIVETLATQWKDAKEAGVTPVEFMEIFTSSMLAKKEKMVDERLAKLQRADKAAALRQAQADADGAQAELQKARDAQSRNKKAKK